MARRAKKKTLNPWTAADLKALRKSAGKIDAGRIAKLLKRTESAVRQKAAALQVSLRV